MELQWTESSASFLSMKSDSISSENIIYIFENIDQIFRNFSVNWKSLKLQICLNFADKILALVCFGSLLKKYFNITAVISTTLFWGLCNVHLRQNVLEIWFKIGTSRLFYICHHYLQCTKQSKYLWKRWKITNYLDVVFIFLYPLELRTQTFLKGSQTWPLGHRLSFGQHTTLILTSSGDSFGEVLISSSICGKQWIKPKQIKITKLLFTNILKFKLKRK